MQDYLRWKEWKEEDFGNFSKQAGKYFSWHIARAVGRSNIDLRILEIGFGNGCFLGYCKKQGLNATGVEVNKELVNRANAAGFKAFSSLEEICPKEPFDLVVAFDVLEHLELSALKSLMEKLPVLLSKEGAVIIRVPNGDSPFSGRHQHGDITHVTCFGEFKFRQIAQAHGLIVTAAGESPWYADEFNAPSLKTLIGGLMRSVIGYFLSMAFYREKIDLSPNLVVVLKADDLPTALE